MFRTKSLYYKDTTTTTKDIQPINRNKNIVISQKQDFFVSEMDIMVFNIINMVPILYENLFFHFLSSGIPYLNKVGPSEMSRLKILMPSQAARGG